MPGGWKIRTTLPLTRSVTGPTRTDMMLPWYFQQAYDVATTAIDNPGSFSLQKTYYDVKRRVERPPTCEIVLYSDRTETSEYYNQSSLTSANASDDNGYADQIYGWFLTWDYTQIRSSSSAATWTGVSSVQREAEQHLGRPWKRMCPYHWRN